MKTDENKKAVIEFMGMISEKFGAIERYNIELSRQMSATEFYPVFVYNVLPKNRFYIDELEKYGAKVIELPLNNGYWTMFNGVRKILNHYKPHIVHTHFSFKLVRAVIFQSWLRKIPLRYSHIRSMPGDNPHFISRLWYKILSLMATKMLTVSDAIRNSLLKKYHLNPNRVDILRIGINTEIFEKMTVDKKEIRTKYQLPQDKIIIGCTAFHQPIKGIDVLLDAVAILKNKYKNDVLLCQIGGYFGNLSNELQQKANELGIQDMVYWQGLQDNVPELLHAFDIYCQPSRSEGLCLAIVEAFLAQLSVVASNVGGIPEVVIDGENGFLVEVENCEQMAEKLELLIKNKELRDKLGKAGQQKMTKEYDVKNQIKKLIENYYTNGKI